MSLSRRLTTSFLCFGIAVAACGDSSSSGGPSGGAGGSGEGGDGASSTGANGSGGDSSTGASSSTGGAGDGSAAQYCVDKINAYRATLGLPPYGRWQSAEACTDQEAASDGASNTPHGAFGSCDELAQNECPGWTGSYSEIMDGCLQLMWDEGPGDFDGHGHYINMSSTEYTEVACGFATLPDGSVWATQNFH